MKFSSAAVFAVILQQQQQDVKSVSSSAADDAGGEDGISGGGNDRRRWDAVPFDDEALKLIDRLRGGDHGDSRKTNQRQQHYWDQGFFLPAMMNGNNIINNNRIRQKQSQLRMHQGQVFGREGQLQLQLQLTNRFQSFPKQQKQEQQLFRSVAMQECYPDLGILACGGLHEYCVSSSRSTTGGFCMDFAGGGRGGGS